MQKFAPAENNRKVLGERIISNYGNWFLGSFIFIPFLGADDIWDYFRFYKLLKSFYSSNHYNSVIVTYDRRKCKQMHITFDRYKFLLHSFR